MKYLFIDANVFLKFYPYSDDHLDILKDLIEFINMKEIKLILPQQVIDEVYRNREKILWSFLISLEKFIGKLKGIPEVPSFCCDIKEIRQVKDYIKKSRSSSMKVYDKLVKEFKKTNLKIDNILSKIFEEAGRIPFDETIFREAKERKELGNPPGEKDTYGDAIVWETLIKVVPEKKDLFFIGEDKHFLSDFDKEEFSPFLRKEWETKKKSKIILYKSISHFLKKEFKKEEISEEEIEEEEKTSAPSYYVLDPYKGFIPASGSSVPITTTASEILPSTDGSWDRSNFGIASLGEEEIKCSYCGRIFYHKSEIFSIGKKCPYCGHTQWS